MALAEGDAGRVTDPSQHLGIPALGSQASVSGYGPFGGRKNEWKGFCLLNSGWDYPQLP